MTSDEDRYVAPPPWAPPGREPGYPVPPTYGPPPWAPPPGYAYRPPAPAPRPTPPPEELRPGLIGLVVAGAGALAVLVAFVLLPWYSLGSGLSTGDVRSLLSARGDVSSTVSIAYFSWFGWTLLLLCAALAVGACAAVWPRPAIVVAARIAGPIVAGFAALFTFVGAELTDSRFNGSDAYYLHHLAAGFWCALAGFVLLGAGCVIGPRRVPVTQLADPFPPGGAATFGK